jgi:hypothetical protein
MKNKKRQKRYIVYLLTPACSWEITATNKTEAIKQCHDKSDANNGPYRYIAIEDK